MFLCIYAMAMADTASPIYILRSAPALMAQLCTATQKEEVSPSAHTAHAQSSLRRMMHVEVRGTLLPRETAHGLQAGIRRARGR